MNMKFSAPCIFGLEGLCANELRYLGVENVNAENGRVTFTGDWSTLALANINSVMRSEYSFFLQNLRFTPLIICSRA